MKNKTLSWGKIYLSVRKNNVFDEDVLGYRHPVEPTEPVTYKYGNEEIAKISNEYGPDSKFPLANIPKLKGPKITQTGWTDLTINIDRNYTYTEGARYIGVDVGKDGLVTKVLAREEDAPSIGGFTINWEQISKKPTTSDGLFLPEMFSYGMPFITSTEIVLSSNPFGTKHVPHPPKYYKLPLRWGTLLTFITNSRRFGLVGKRKYAISVREPKGRPDFNVPYQYSPEEKIPSVLRGVSLHKDLIAGTENLRLKPASQRGDSSGVPEAYWLRSRKDSYPTPLELDGITEIPNTAMPKRTLKTRALGNLYRVVVPVRYDQLTDEQLNNYNDRNKK